MLPLVPGYVSYVAGHSTAERSAGTISLRLQMAPLSGFSVWFADGYWTIASMELDL